MYFRRDEAETRGKFEVAMLEVLVAAFLVPMAISAIVVPFIRGLAPTLGLIDQPGHRKVHVQPTPRSGGIAVWLGIVLTILIGVLGWKLQWPGFAARLETLTDSMTGNPERMRQLMAVAVGGCLLFFVGLADDRFNLSWKIRLGIQLSVAAGVSLAGVRATIFVSQPWIGLCVSILWIMILTNAMNFLDNMDALSAGIGVIASLIFAVILVVLLHNPVWSVAIALVMLAGSLTGFLFWNRPPASIFMGDCGSNLIGFLLATLTIVGTFYDHSGSRHVILAPLCVLAIPLYDFSTVILIRLRQGRSPFHGDKSHFSHRLVELGLRPGPAVLTIHLATLMTGLGGVLLYKVSDWSGAVVVLSLIVCVLCIVAILETVGRRSVNQMTAIKATQEANHNMAGAGGPDVAVTSPS
ncbi:MAG: undecaprenyl/decaprenyl-phosphate alpha-N-acetylglucosaminyl 1-phosphate transferase [Planctomycetaceae bacterium]|nr:undecaprenyl/decaprenyl-phosphate alpha-N-acetylglucosaminyl 1-phosphate transferase [Planctomycetaceae bacterium]